MGRSPEVARSGKRRHLGTTPKGTQTRASGISVGQDTINDATDFATQQSFHEVHQLPGASVGLELARQ